MNGNSQEGAALGSRKPEPASTDAQSFQMLVAHVRDYAIYLLDLEGHITTWNEGAERNKGYKAAEVIGKKFDIFFSPEDVAAERPQRLLAEARLYGQAKDRGWRCRKDGTQFLADVVVAPLISAEGEPYGFIKLVRDVTEQQRSEEQREKFDRRLQEAQKLESLGILAGGIAHDFNNILTSILGNSSLAALELAETSPVQSNLENIKQASLRAAELCRQMLAYSGKGRFVVKAVSLNRLVEETTQLLQISIGKSVVLRFNLSEASPTIEADETQIRQVIMNLVINASEAIGTKSGVISINTGITRVDQTYLSSTFLAPELPEGTYAYVEVSDTGCGMLPETQARIFDPFFTTKFSGRGLGLAAVLGIVRGHKGTIKIYSEQKRGTTFKLLFPYAAGGAELVGGVGANLIIWHGQGTVLIVDDEETVRSTAALMLRKLGLEVLLAADGREAVEIFRADPARISLVLMDLTMPHLDGEQAFVHMRSIKPEIKVILMSGFNEQEAISRFAGKGLASFLQKPFQFSQVSNILQKSLEVT